MLHGQMMDGVGAFISLVIPILAAIHSDAVLTTVMITICITLLSFVSNLSGLPLIVAHSGGLSWSGSWSRSSLRLRKVSGGSNDWLSEHRLALPLWLCKSLATLTLVFGLSECPSSHSSASLNHRCLDFCTRIIISY